MWPIIFPTDERPPRTRGHVALGRRDQRTVDVTDSPALVGRVPPGIPGWRNAPCLGCGRKVIQSRDGWVTVGGTRSGSYLIVWGVTPLLSHSTDPSRVPDEKLFMLGVAHRGCIDKARYRLENGSVILPDDLPDLEIEMGDQVPRAPYTLDKPAEVDACPFCDSRIGLTREHVWPTWYSRELHLEALFLRAISLLITASKLQCQSVEIAITSGCRRLKAMLSSSWFRWRTLAQVVARPCGLALPSRFA